MSPSARLVTASWTWALIAASAAGLLTRGLSAASPFSFRTETIDDKIEIGYGLALEDVDGDGKPDILLADKSQFVWYQNPTWKRHVITENLTVRDNVCLAARDINGDGKAEIAVGAQWNPGDTVESGSVHYLVAPDDRTQRWTAVELHREPTVHRMRWVQADNGNHALVVAPLHGRGNKQGMGAGVRLLAYYPPGDGAALNDAAAMRKPWRTELLDDTLHQTHNFDSWPGASGAEEILYIGAEGALKLTRQEGQWRRQELPGVMGGGEIRRGVDQKSSPFIATIEPMHGDRLVLYSGDKLARQVLDDSLAQGHAIAVGSFGGQRGGQKSGQRDGQQIVAGWRNPNRDKLVGVKLFFQDAAGTWQSQWIDRGEMAAEDIRLADLNADGKLDIVAAGRATKNLRIYWGE